MLTSLSTDPLLLLAAALHSSSVPSSHLPHSILSSDSSDIQLLATCAALLTAAALPRCIHQHCVNVSLAGIKGATSGGGALHPAAAAAAAAHHHAGQQQLSAQVQQQLCFCASCAVCCGPSLLRAQLSSGAAGREALCLSGSLSPYACVQHVSSNGSCSNSSSSSSCICRVSVFFSVKAAAVL